MVDALAGYVEQFVQYLWEQRSSDLGSATAADVEVFAGDLEASKKGSARKVLRGVGLYYDLIGQEKVASVAWRIREEAIARTRKVFALKDFRGLNRAHVQRLAAEGIVSVQQMLEAGKTSALRTALSDRTGIPLEAILELVKLSALARVGGLGSVRARLCDDADVDTVETLAQRDPEELQEMFLDYVERSTGFDGIAPLPKELRNAVATARELPRIVEY